MRHENGEKKGTEIKPEEPALVAEANGELRLILPEYTDDEDVPLMVPVPDRLTA